MILDNSALPLPFCPGCGHAEITKEIAAAIEKCNYQPHQVVIVTDIGCCGIIDKYFTTHTFHGLHGRVITYATGLKLACPNLKVIAVMGDGGAGIGAAHLVAAARRNIGITVVVYNNFNFSMTGGQLSPTTPLGAITSSSHYGNIEYPMDICKLVDAMGANFVARTTVYDQNLPEIMVEAIKEEGFALVDVLDICTAYFARRNKLTKKSLKELIKEYNLAEGIITRRHRQEYTRLYQQEIIEKASSSKSTRTFLSVKYKSNIAKKTRIIIAGSAGQRIRTTATTLATAGVLSGLFATQKDDFPITVMTGHSVSEVILSPEEILYTGIDVPDIMLIISIDGLNYVTKKIKAADENCTVIVDSKLDLPETKARVIRSPFSSVLAQVGRGAIGIVAITSLVKRFSLLPVDALREAVTCSLPEFAKDYLPAIEIGEKLDL